MTDTRSQKFMVVKYVIISVWILQIIGCLILIIFGAFTISASNTMFEMKTPNFSDHDEETAAKLLGSVLIVVGVISSPIVLIGIYGAHKESYTINVVMAVLSVLGALLVIVTGGSIVAIIVDGAFGAILIYYCYLIKHDENDFNQSNVIELEKNYLNENSGINTYPTEKPNYMSENSSLVP